MSKLTHWARSVKPAPAENPYVIKIEQPSGQLAHHAIESGLVLLGGLMLTVLGGSALPALVGLGIATVGLVALLWTIRAERRNIPAFEADRTGFRVRGGRLRPWHSYKGVRVRDLRGKHFVKEGEIVEILVRGTLVFGHVRVAVLRYSESGWVIADEIESFYHKILSLRLDERDGFSAAAPVVAARSGSQAMPRSALGRFFARLWP